jgi:catalase
MANIIPATVQAAQHAVMGSKGDKIADMARDTKEPSDKDRLTSDFGVRQSNTDDWLRVANGDHTGPSLLEDQFAREKVYLHNSPTSLYSYVDHQYRSIDSTMNVYQRE